jgi:hypothetical protein
MLYLGRRNCCLLRYYEFAFPDRPPWSILDSMRTLVSLENRESSERTHEEYV